MIACGSAMAETQYTTENGTYTLGDNDTKAQAQKACIENAKQSAIEKAGVFVNSNFQDRKHEGEEGYKESSSVSLSSISAGIVLAEVQSQSMMIEPSGHQVTNCVVRVGIDPEEIKKASTTASVNTDQLKKLNEEVAALKMQIAEQQKKQADNQVPSNVSQNTQTTAVSVPRIVDEDKVVYTYSPAPPQVVYAPPPGYVERQTYTLQPPPPVRHQERVFYIHPQTVPYGYYQTVPYGYYQRSVSYGGWGGARRFH
jgi:hypothetical protein